MSDDPWKSLVGSSARIVGKRIAGIHPLDFYWARAHDGSPGLVLRNINRAWIPKELPRLRGLLLSPELDGEVPEVTMFLREPAERDVFLALCLDVIAYSADGEGVEESVRRFFRRLGHWHSLMAHARVTSMEPHEIRGLIGELIVLEQLMHSSALAVAAWVAPEDHPQDFALSDRILEVKARSSGSRNNVQISSLEQLESGPLPLFLLVVELVESEASDARSLSAIVDAVLAIARLQGPGVEDRLESALIKRGYARHDQYGVDRYRLVGVCAFSVRDDFPRIGRSLVDSRIVKANYTLDLSLLANFAVPTESVLS